MSAGDAASCRCRYATDTVPSGPTPTIELNRSTQSLDLPVRRFFSADQVAPLSSDQVRTGSLTGLLGSVRKRESSQPTYTRPLLGSTAAVGRPGDARCNRGSL